MCRGSTTASDRALHSKRGAVRAAFLAAWLAVAALAPASSLGASARCPLRGGDRRSDQRAARGGACRRRGPLSVDNAGRTGQGGGARLAARSAVRAEGVRHRAARPHGVRGARRPRLREARALGCHSRCAARDQSRRAARRAKDNDRRSGMARGDAAARLCVDRSGEAVLRAVARWFQRRSERARPAPRPSDVLRRRRHKECLEPPDRGAPRGRRSRREEGDPGCGHRRGAGQPREPRVSGRIGDSRGAADDGAEKCARRDRGRDRAMAAMVVSLPARPPRRAHRVVAALPRRRPRPAGALSRLARRDVRALYGSRSELGVPRLV